VSLSFNVVISTEAFSYPFTGYIWQKESVETFLSYIPRAAFPGNSRDIENKAEVEGSRHKFPQFMFLGVK